MFVILSIDRRAERRHSRPWKCAAEKLNRSWGGELLQLLNFHRLICPFCSLGVSKESRGRVVEQISRDLRVFIVGGGSEEIMDDFGIRLMLAQNRTIIGGKL